MRDIEFLEVDLLGLLELGEPTAEDRVMVEVIWGTLTIIRIILALGVLAHSIEDTTYKTATILETVKITTPMIRT